MKKLIGLLAVALMLVAAGCEEYKKDIILINNTDEPLFCLHIDSNDGNKAPPVEHAFRWGTPKLVQPGDTTAVYVLQLNSTSTIIVYVYRPETLEEHPLMEIFEKNIYDNIFSVSGPKARENHGVFNLMPNPYNRP